MEPEITNELTDQLIGTARVSAPLRLAATEESGKRKRKEYKVTLIAAGFARRRDGQPSDFYISAEALRQAAPMFGSAAAFVDHAQEGFWSMGYPETKHLAGVVVDPEWNEAEQSIDAKLRLNSRSDMQWLSELLDEIIEDQDQGEPTPDLGLSAVIFVDSEWVEQGNTRIRKLTRIKSVESVDVVFGPGAKGKFREKLARLPLGEGLVSSANVQRTFAERLEFDVIDRERTDSTAERSRLTNQHAQNGGVKVEDNIEVQQPATPAIAPAAPDLTALLLQQQQALTALTQQVAVLTGALAQREEPSVVEGLGSAPRGNGARITMSTGEDDFRNAVDWLFGVPGAKLPVPSLRSSKHIYEALTGDYEWRDMFDGSRVMLGSANPTTLPGLAVDSMNKVIVSLWDGLAMYRWFEMIVAVQPNDGSLHDMDWVQFGGIANLPVVADGASYTELTVDDSRESDSPVKHGGYVGITRKMLRNSDIARIQAVPRQLAVAAVRTRSNNIATIFTQASGTGPTLDQDSTVLFHSNHGNVATTAFSYSAWKAARIECFKQTELGSAKRQGLWPKFALVPADLYDDALQTFGYATGNGGEPGTAQNEGNVYALSRPGDPRPIAVAVPEFTDANDWAYIADPMLAPVIQMSYSASPGGGSHPVPELYSVTSETAGLMFTADTMPIKVRDEYWFGVATYRGIGKRNVA